MLPAVVVGLLFSENLNSSFHLNCNNPLKIIISMLPAVIIGLLFEEELESLFGGKIVLVGVMLLLTALLLLLADKAKNTKKEVSFSNAVLIGNNNFY